MKSQDITQKTIVGYDSHSNLQTFLLPFVCFWKICVQKKETSNLSFSKKNSEAVNKKL